MRHLPAITDKDITGSDKLKTALIWSRIHDIPDCDRFAKIDPVTKGWSNDEKYHIVTDDGRRMLLRVSDRSEFDRKRTEYGMMERVYNLGVFTSQPLGFGLCDEGKSVYSLSAWLDGESADIALPLMPKAKQYLLGIKTGEILRKIHSFPAPENAEPWGGRFLNKVKKWMDEYASRPQIHFDIGDMLIDYLNNHSDIPHARPQTLTHGDCNIENIIVMPNDEIGVIDFSGYNTPYGDPWWDMDNMTWMTTLHPYFYTGQIRGFFQGEPPAEFWTVKISTL